MNLVSTEWLEKNLNTVKIFDASWHMPSTNRNAKNEYKKKHIKGAIFWDVNEHSDRNSPFPHMMTNAEYWKNMLWSFGILNDDHVVIYDNSDLYSSCRLWFALKYFGHEKVSVLDGGLKKWLRENRSVSSDIVRPEVIKKYKVNEKPEWIKNKKQIDENIKNSLFKQLMLEVEKDFLEKLKNQDQALKKGV